MSVSGSEHPIRLFKTLFDGRASPLSPKPFHNNKRTRAIHQSLSSFFTDDHRKYQKIDNHLKNTIRNGFWNCPNPNRKIQPANHQPIASSSIDFSLDFISIGNPVTYIIKSSEKTLLFSPFSQQPNRAHEKNQKRKRKRLNGKADIIVVGYNSL